MARAHRFNCWLAVVVVLALAGAVRAQGRGGGAVLPDDPGEIIATLDGFKLELVIRSQPQKHGSWISMNKDDKGRLLLGGQRGQPLTRLTVENGKVVKEEVLKLPVSEIMGMLWVGDSLYVNGGAKLPGENANSYGLFRMHDPAGVHFHRHRRGTPRQHLDPWEVVLDPQPDRVVQALLSFVCRRHRCAPVVKKNGPAGPISPNR